MEHAGGRSPRPALRSHAATGRWAGRAPGLPGRSQPIGPDRSSPRHVSVERPRRRRPRPQGAGAQRALARAAGGLAGAQEDALLRAGETVRLTLYLLAAIACLAPWSAEARLRKQKPATK